MEALGRILEPFLRDLGAEKSMRRYKAVGLWPDVVGERIAAISEAKDFRRGKLFVSVQSDVWRHELIYYKKDIIQELNKKLGDTLVDDIVLM